MCPPLRTTLAVQRCPFSPLSSLKIVPTDLMPLKCWAVTPSAEGRRAAAVDPSGGAVRPEGSVAESMRSGVQKRMAASAVQSPSAAGTAASEAEGSADGPVGSAGVGPVGSVGVGPVGSAEVRPVGSAEVGPDGPVEVRPVGGFGAGAALREGPGRVGVGVTGTGGAVAGLGHGGGAQQRHGAQYRDGPEPYSSAGRFGSLHSGFSKRQAGRHQDPTGRRLPWDSGRDTAAESDA